MRRSEGMIPMAILAGAAVAGNPEALAFEEKRERFEAKSGATLIGVLTEHGLYFSVASLDAFRSVNSGSDALIAKRAYQLPVVRVSAPSVEDALKSRGITDAGRYASAVSEYNAKFNPEGKGILVPDWGSGFYVQALVRSTPKSPTSSTVQAKPDGKPAVVATPAEPQTPRVREKLASPERSMHMPYPRLRDKLNAESIAHPGILKDYCFVIDPGHGGSDPGTQGHAVHGNGLEAPIVYDVAMRVLERLGTLGGLVYLTHYSETHGARDVDYPTRIPTRFEFGGGDVTGTSQVTSLRARKRISERVVSDASLSHGRKVIFISLHADYAASGDRKGVGVYVDARRGQKPIEADLEFAKRLAAALGQNASTHVQGLYVLRDNAAAHRVLIELGNVANQAELTALLGDKAGRAKHADRVTDSIVRALDIELTRR